MLRSRSLALIAATVLVVAIGGSTYAASKAQSVYVTQDTDCAAPIDLQDNHIPSLGDAYVWLKKVTPTDASNLVWSLWQGGVMVADGEFGSVICTTADGKYSLVYPYFRDGVFDGTGTYTVKVTWNATQDWKAFSNDSFSVP